MRSNFFTHQDQGPKNSLASWATSSPTDEEELRLGVDLVPLSLFIFIHLILLQTHTLFLE